RRAGRRRRDPRAPVRRPDDDAVPRRLRARVVGPGRDRALRAHPRLVRLGLRGVQRLVQRQDESRPPLLAQPRPRRYAVLRALLPYERLRTASDPRATLLAFCQSAYEAGARLGGWNVTGFESKWCPTQAQLRELQTTAADELGRPARA